MCVLQNMAHDADFICVYPQPQVDESMANLEEVVRERNRAYYDLEVGDWRGEQACYDNLKQGDSGGLRVRLGLLGLAIYPRLMGSYCRYLLPKQDGGTTQLRDHQNHPVQMHSILFSFSSTMQFNYMLFYIILAHNI